jgi:hypothetical protein
MGLEIDSEVLSTYAAIDAAANGPELWNVLWGIPAVRCCVLPDYQELAVWVL